PATAFAASTRCTRTTRGPPSLSARRATSQIGPSGHPPPRVPRTTSPRLEIKILKPGLASVDPSVFVTVATANASRRDASSFRRSVYSGVFTERGAPPGAIYLSPDPTGRRREDSRHCFGSFCIGLERISRHVSTRIDRGRAPLSCENEIAPRSRHPRDDLRASRDIDTKPARCPVEPPPSNRPFPPGPGRPSPWDRGHPVVLLSPTRDNVMSGCNRDEVIRPPLFPTTKSRRSAGTRRGQGPVRSASRRKQPCAGELSSN